MQSTQHHGTLLFLYVESSFGSLSEQAYHVDQVTAAILLATILIAVLTM